MRGQEGTSKRKVLPQQGGAVAVEFALVLPIFLALIFGLINFGVFFSQQLTLNNALREGARKAVVNEVNTANRSCQGIIDNSRTAMVGLALDPDDVEFRISTDGFTSDEPCSPSTFSTSTSSPTNLPCEGSFETDGSSGAAGSLVVEGQFEADALVPLPVIGPTLTISGKAVYRCEFS